MGNIIYIPYLKINSGKIEIVKEIEFEFFDSDCHCTRDRNEYSIDRLSDFKFNSKLNFDVDNFIKSINKILKKFYKGKIKNFKAFIISLDNLLEFYLDEEEIKEANDIFYSPKISTENLREMIVVFEKLFDHLEIINEKEKKNFIRAIKSILVDDRVLDGNEINSFIEILTQIFDKNIYEQKDSSSKDYEEIMVEKHLDLSSSLSNFSSYSKNSQHQIRKLEEEIKRLKKLVPKEKDN